jgi:hypothetical protein
MRLAQVIDGVVVNVAEVADGWVPEHMQDWLTCEHAGPGWLWTGEEFVSPPEPPIARDEAIAQIIAMIDTAAAVITGPVPEVERLSWTAKEAAARAWRDGIAPPEMVALLTIEASTKGETLADLANSVIRNADLYRAAVAQMTGMRRRAIADLDAGEDARTVLARLRDDLAVVSNVR